MKKKPSNSLPNLKLFSFSDTLRWPGHSGIEKKIDWKDDVFIQVQKYQHTLKLACAQISVRLSQSALKLAFALVCVHSTKRVLNKACAQLSVHSKQRALNEVCYQHRLCCTAEVSMHSTQRALRSQKNLGWLLCRCFSHRKLDSVAIVVTHSPILLQAVCRISLFLVTIEVSQDKAFGLIKILLMMVGKRGSQNPVCKTTSSIKCIYPHSTHLRGS